MTVQVHDNKKADRSIKLHVKYLNTDFWDNTETITVV